MKQLAIERKQPLHFYPEGGALMKGVNNKVVAVGNAGEKVTITDAQDREISSAVLDRFGIGTLYFTPSEAETYKGVSGNNQIELPSITSKPVSMVITPSLSGSPLKIALEKMMQLMVTHFTLPLSINVTFIIQTKSPLEKEAMRLLRCPMKSCRPGCR